MVVDKNKINQYLLDGFWGLEKESLRVDNNGLMANTAHPFEDEKKIDRDFCENQIEIITDVNSSCESVYTELKKLHRFAVSRLYNLESGKEFIWNNSNPPFIKDEDDIGIAKFHTTLKDKEIYREYLAEKYGKYKMTYSGIHYNFSFSDKYFDAINQNKIDRKEFSSKFYLNLAGRALEYSWLIVFLMAASPVVDESFMGGGNTKKTKVTKYASCRCSEIGYWNDFVPILNYDSLENYVSSIKKYVDDGQLSSASELYYPVRIKPRGVNDLDLLLERGIDHIELRNIDLNPLTEIGISLDDIKFIHLFLVYLACLEDKKIEDVDQVMYIKNAKRAALLDENVELDISFDENKKIKDFALDMLYNIKDFYKLISKEEYIDMQTINDYIRVIDIQIEKVTEPKKRYANLVKEKYGDNYLEKTFMDSKNYAKSVCD